MGRVAWNTPSFDGLVRATFSHIFLYDPGVINGNFVYGPEGGVYACAYIH